jgi:type IV secretory pathway VirB9-like protein
MHNPTIKTICLATLLTLPAGFSFAQSTAPAATSARSKPKAVVLNPEQVQATAAEMQKQVASSLQPSIFGSINGPDPLDRDVPLPPNGISAIQEANQFIYADTPPKVDQDGWVTWEFGHGLPIAILKPNQLTAVRLGKGEVVSVPSISVGDSSRIDVTPVLSGEGPDANTYVILKSHRAGVTSDVTFSTNKRFYTIRVISKPLDYTPRVAFAYPDEDHQKALQEYEQQQKQREDRERDAALQQAADDRQALNDARQALEEAQLNAPPKVSNTNYQIKAKRRPKATSIYPVSVFDDRVKTYIDFPKGMQTLPSWEAWIGTGQDAPNFRYEKQDDHQRLILDGVFTRIDLLSGTGRRQQRITIVNKATEKAVQPELKEEVQSARR